MNEVIHAPLRLRMCAALVEGSELEFSTLRDLIAASDSVTSKHLKVLSDAGYVRINKSSTGTGRRTWVLMTRKGRTEFERYVRELKSLLDQSDRTTA